MKSTLNNALRPLVEFDVTNREHRNLYFSFIKNHSWGKCPYRFKTSGYGNTKGVIDQKLLEYYTSREFSNQ